MYPVSLLRLALFLKLAQIGVEVTSDPEGATEEEAKVAEVETRDGCPYSYDFGRLAYKYKRPKLCQTLLPPELQGLPHQASKKPFIVTMELNEFDETFYNIILSVAEGFNETIAGGVIRVQRLKPNGKASIELPAGHLEGDPPWESGYCCSKSKFNTLIAFFQNDVKRRKTQEKARWYPMNFGDGRIILTANVFAETGVYWKIRSLEVKIPIVTATSTTRVEE